MLIIATARLNRPDPRNGPIDESNSNIAYERRQQSKRDYYALQINFSSISHSRPTKKMRSVLSNLGAASAWNFVIANP